MSTRETKAFFSECELNAKKEHDEQTGVPPYKLQRKGLDTREDGNPECLMHALGGILDIDHRGQSYIRGARRACDGDRVDEEASAMRRRLAVASFRRPKVACSGRVLA